MDEQKCETLAVAICDDEPEILKQLERLAQTALAGIPAAFYAMAQPQSLMKEKRSFDIAILDIRFPGFNGIQLARWLLIRNPLCQILFVSSFPTYVSDVYDVPHLVMILKDQIQAQLPKYLRRAVQNLWASGSVKLASAGVVRVFDAAKIVCLERNGRVTEVTMQDGEVITCADKLSSLQLQLPAERFCRCHASYIVNLQYVTEHRRGRFTLSTGAVVPISRANVEQSREEFMRYLRLME